MTTDSQPPHELRHTPAERKRILHQRAVELGHKETRPDEDWVLTDVLEFTMAGRRFAFESVFVREVRQLNQLTPLPNIPDFIPGITSVRSKIYAVYDLRLFFGIPIQGITDFDKLILLESGEMEIGVLADTIVDVRAINTGRLHVGTPPFPNMQPEHIAGVDENGLIVLDAKALLDDPRIIVDQSNDS